MTIYTKKDFYPKGKRAFRILRVFWKKYVTPERPVKPNCCPLPQDSRRAGQTRRQRGTIFKITVVVFIVNNFTFIVFINIVNVY